MILVCGLCLRTLRIERRSVHVGHHHVGDEKMDRRRSSADDRQGFFSARCFQHVVAAKFERACGEAPDRFFILDKENCVLPG